MNIDVTQDGLDESIQDLLGAIYEFGVHIDTVCDALEDSLARTTLRLAADKFDSAVSCFECEVGIDD